MTMAVSDIETQDLLKSIDAKLDSIATIMAKNANVAENGKSSEMEQELIRTRKALDRAKWWLHEIVENHRFTPISTAEMALKEIAALEQKE